ncbi:DUF397 domain-containing protein [Cryptosporangium sp. NPDC051539]|uniref:DUF397 domain-containing protein n=1 Tax=Cryptosporangium sp. NPDC051539 TaxID=3363962 RepID=UPI0037A2FF7B
MSASATRRNHARRSRGRSLTLPRGAPSGWAGMDVPNRVQTSKYEDGQVHLRDSKNPTGPHLSMTGDQWVGFLDFVSSLEARKAGR